MSDSLRPHELQHSRPPCPSPTPGVHPNSCPLSRWCHAAISSFCPLLLLPPVPPSIRVFSNESALCLRWPKYWSFCLSISPSNEHSGLISFRMDWLDLLAVQGTLKSLLQHHSSKASILRHSVFFTVQLSNPYMTTGKTIALIRQTLVSKVGEGNGTPLQYSCLKNPMDGGAWWAAVHGVAKSRARLSNFTFTFHFHALEKEGATHSSVLAWRIPGTGEAGGLPSVGSHRVGHNWSDLAAAAGFLEMLCSQSEAWSPLWNNSGF